MHGSSFIPYWEVDIVLTNVNVWLLLIENKISMKMLANKEEEGAQGSEKTQLAADFPTSFL